jgi:hypothetical protein
MHAGKQVIAARTPANRREIPVARTAEFVRCYHVLDRAGRRLSGHRHCRFLHSVVGQLMSAMIDHNRSPRTTSQGLSSSSRRTKVSACNIWVRKLSYGHSQLANDATRRESELGITLAIRGTTGYV